MRRLALAAILAAAPAGAQEINDFPTNARADYVFVCMATNGQTREMLDKCSCSIDQIASVLSYDAYVKAETILRMQQASGGRNEMFRGMPAMEAMVADLRRAEAEAEILCF